MTKNTFGMTWVFWYFAFHRPMTNYISMNGSPTYDASSSTYQSFSFNPLNPYTSFRQFMQIIQKSHVCIYVYTHVYTCVCIYTLTLPLQLTSSIEMAMFFFAFHLFIFVQCIAMRNYITLNGSHTNADNWATTMKIGVDFFCCTVYLNQHFVMPHHSIRGNYRTTKAFVAQQ